MTNRHRTTLFLALSAAVCLLAGAEYHAEAGHNPPVATFAVDVNPAGNVFNADPNGDGNVSDNSLTVDVADFCVQVAAAGPTQIDIVARNMAQAVAYDIRLGYDAALATVAAVNHTPFADPQGVAVGFLNLPVVPNSQGRTEIFPANNINTEGTAFFAATYTGRRDSLLAPDHPHAPTAEEPYSATDPDGVTLIRLTVSLKPEANGKVVNLDLRNDPAPGNDYVSFDVNAGGPTPEETIPVPDTNLIDGAIAVNTGCPAPPPGAGPVAPGPTPGPGGATAPGSSPGESPDGTDGEDGTESPSPDSASPGSEDDGDDGRDGDDDGGGPLGTGSDAEIPLLVVLALLIPAGAAGGYWWWRRRLR